MLPDTITVDTSWFSTTGAEGVYSRHREGVDTSKYIHGTEHSSDSRSQLQFYATEAKRSGASRGARKATIKFTRDVDVPNAQGDGDIRLPLIGQLSFSIPEGTTEADLRECVLRLACMIAWDDADPLPGAVQSSVDLVSLLSV